MVPWNSDISERRSSSDTQNWRSRWRSCSSSQGRHWTAVTAGNDPASLLTCLIRWTTWWSCQTSYLCRSQILWPAVSTVTHNHNILSKGKFQIIIISIDSIESLIYIAVIAWGLTPGRQVEHQPVKCSVQRRWKMDC